MGNQLYQRLMLDNIKNQYQMVTSFLNHLGQRSIILLENVDAAFLSSTAYIGFSRVTLRGLLDASEGRSRGTCN
jgi:hypothetical protein